MSDVYGGLHLRARAEPDDVRAGADNDIIRRRDEFYVVAQHT